MSAKSLAAALSGAIGNNSEILSVSDWLGTSYLPLNKILGGSVDAGIPFGRIVEIFGPSSSGKTALATMMMIQAQQQGGVAIFIDWEGTFDKGIAENMGLNTEFPFFVYKRPDTWEEGNTVAMKAAEAIRNAKAIDEHAPIVAVFDSIASAIPKSVFDKGIDEYTMNDTTALARVTSTTLKAINQVVGKFNMSAIYLNQIRTKPGVSFGDPTTTPGGQATEFYASIRLSLSRKQIKDEKTKQLTGQIITAKTVKNKLTRPQQLARWIMAFDDKGTAKFDTAASMVDFLIENGGIEKTGNRHVWTEGRKLSKKVIATEANDEPAKMKLLEEMTKKVLGN